MTKKYMQPEDAAFQAESDAIASGKFMDWIHAGKLWKLSGDDDKWLYCLEMAAGCKDAEG